MWQHSTHQLLNLDIFFFFPRTITCVLSLSLSLRHLQKKGNERLSGKLEACKLQSDSICGGWEEVGDVGTILRLETAAITEVLP